MPKRPTRLRTPNKERSVERQVVGQKLKQYRERKAWTQEHLAEAARVASRTVQRAEEGVMSAETLSALAGALNVPVERFAVAPPPPDQWPRLSGALFYENTNRAIEFLEKAFGFSAREKVPGPDGRIVHAELELHEAVVMIGLSGFDARLKSPLALGGAGSMFLHLFVDDLDGHCARAREAGATIETEPATAHGQRRYLARDCEGHLWSFAEPA